MTVPKGWIIRHLEGVLDRIVIVAPNGCSTVVSKIDSSTSKILYLMAKEMLTLPNKEPRE